MNVKQNIGIVNALIRITIGFTVVAWSTSKLVKRPWRDSYLVMAMLGGMKIGEGILRFCPVTFLFERQKEMMNDKENSYDLDENESTMGDFDNMTPYNPS